jgi:hypothetical protein
MDQTVALLLPQPFAAQTQQEEVRKMIDNDNTKTGQAVSICGSALETSIYEAIIASAKAQESDNPVLAAHRYLEGVGVHKLAHDIASRLHMSVVVWTSEQRR